MLEIDEGAVRLLANLEQHYAGWLQAERNLRSGRLTWKTVSDKQYLYAIVDGAGNGRSLGPRSATTEARFQQWETAKSQSTSLMNRMLMEGAQARALRLPTIAAFAGQVLRQLDIEEALGDKGVLVVGTNALIAYAIEARQRFDTTLSATEDFDLTWVREDPAPGSRPLLDALKQADRTWTINSERPFQVLNARGDEIELLMPTKLASKFPHTGFQPLDLPEQDWLLPGTRVDHVVACMDRKPARIIAPDPRWFALHKLWLADKPQRNALKKPKDGAQGLTLLEVIAERMPHFPLDDAFGAGLPEELASYFAQWREDRPSNSADGP